MAALRSPPPAIAEVAKIVASADAVRIYFIMYSLIYLIRASVWLPWEKVLRLAQGTGKPHIGVNFLALWTAHDPESVPRQLDNSV